MTPPPVLPYLWSVRERGFPNKDGLLSPTLSSIVPLAEREQRPLAFNEEFCLHSLSRPAWKTTLGTPDSPFYSGRVSGFLLRFVGMVNAAIWFGAGIFFAAVILPRGVLARHAKKSMGPARLSLLLRLGCARLIQALLCAAIRLWRCRPAAFVRRKALPWRPLPRLRDRTRHRSVFVSASSGRLAATADGESAPDHVFRPLLRRKKKKARHSFRILARPFRTGKPGGAGRPPGSFRAGHPSGRGRPPCRIHQIPQLTKTRLWRRLY